MISFYGEEGALHSFRKWYLFRAMLCSTTVDTFVMDMKPVGGVKNTSPFAPPKEALFTFFGVYIEHSCTASLVTSVTTSIFGFLGLRRNRSENL